MANTRLRKALVTGGADPQGIGFAAACSLARFGFDVVVTGVSEMEIAATPPQEGIRSELLDVRDNRSVTSMIASFDYLDAVVNCAGTSGRNEYDPADFAATIDVNLTGTMRVCVSAHRALTERRGCIVNVASMYSTFGSDIVPAYSASKGGVVQLTKSLAAAWAADGIRVNAIAPGWIRTQMARALWDDPVASQSIVARTPMKRWGEPAECGDVIAFLCSDQARFVTGVTIPVDGGYLVVG